MLEILFAVLCFTTPKTGEALNSDGTKVQVTMGYETGYKAVRVMSLEDWCLKPPVSSCRPELYRLWLSGAQLKLEPIAPVCIRPRVKAKGS